MIHYRTDFVNSAEKKSREIDLTTERSRGILLLSTIPTKNRGRFRADWAALSESRLSDKKFLSIEDLSNLEPPKWRIESLFDINSLVMIAGPAASFKSAMVLDMALSMSSGRDWCGLSTEPGKVLYVLGEGKSGLMKRIHAWLTYHAPSVEEKTKLEESFRVSFEVPQLAYKVNMKDMLKDLEREQFEPNVIIVDTFARSFVGLNENDSQYTGMWIESADNLRQLGYTVIFLHHTKKNTEFGLSYRGSTAIMGAMDTAFTMQRHSEFPDKVILKCSKQKDHMEPPPMWLERKIVKADEAKEGSIVLVPSHRPNGVDYEEKAADEARIDEILTDLLNNETFSSDRARARELATQTTITETAAQTRISRRRRNEEAEL